MSTFSLQIQVQPTLKSINPYMVHRRDRNPQASIQQLVDKILERGKLNPQEHFYLITALLSEYKVTPAERRNINRVLDQLQSGQLKLEQ